jgi:hypothetical protein
VSGGVTPAAIAVNAAPTSLGSQNDGISDGLNNALMVGAVAGGGLTVNASPPNPAGIGILRNAKALEGEGVRPPASFLGSLTPTVVAIAYLCRWTPKLGDCARMGSTGDCPERWH